MAGAAALSAAEPGVTGDVRAHRGPAAEAGDHVVLTLTKPTGRAVVTFSFGGAPLDLSKYRDIAIPIKNGTSAELDAVIAASSDPAESWAHGTSGRFLVRAGEDLLMTALLARPNLDSAHPHVKVLGRLFGYPWGHNHHWGAPDPSTLKEASVRLRWRNAEPGQTITIGKPTGAGDFSTDPALLDTFKLPMVDEFGQAVWMDWPGKVRNVQELEEDGRRDEKFAATVNGFGGERSRFGGWAGGPQREATGFFRVEKIDGKWWFVDPEGWLFWSLGVNSTGYGADTIIEGRERLFPESMRGHQRLRIYDENLKRKYGDDWRQRHAEVTVARMRDWGVNTSGAWPVQDFVEPGRIPYTLIIHTATQRLGSLTKVPDPFSTAFADALDKGLASLAEDHSQSPWLLGVFIDNEINWTGDAKLAGEVLASPPQTPARVAMVEFLRERHGDIAGLNAAWGTDFADFADVRPAEEPGREDAYHQDLDDFLEVFAAKYFGACRAAMDKYFPRHLYLGCRFHVRNPRVRSVASRYCDVLSVNIYQHTVEGYSMKTEVDRPWLISEFHFGMRDYGSLGSGLSWAADTGNQADLVQAYLSDALRHPNFVGAHWFAWGDQAVTGRPDGENFGVGLVTVVDRPVGTLVEAMRNVSRSLYDFRHGDVPGRIGEGKTRVDARAP